ncbi:MAG: class I SAM-dependent methyltransferase [Chloroflexota bacterium]|nr:class I SAM-dependent methyltransferase [Chloroflexota bacterium]
MIRAYFNQRAAIWDETAAEKDTTKLEQVAEHLNIEPGSTVLDVGTGTGVFVPFILSRIGKNGRLVCLDFAEEMLKRAQAKGFKGNIDYVCADIANSWLDAETFDAVVCYSSFPHFQDKPRALSEIYRVLKKGGRLFICHTSSRATINGVHRQIPEVQNDLIPPEDEVHQMLSEAGVTDINICDNSDSYLASARKPGQGELV